MSLKYLLLPESHPLVMLDSLRVINSYNCPRSQKDCTMYKFFSSKSYAKTKLENGLNIYSIEMPSDNGKPSVIARLVK